MNQAQISQRRYDIKLNQKQVLLVKDALLQWARNPKNKSTRIYSESICSSIDKQYRKTKDFWDKIGDSRPEN